jgi:signal transduction histidine kinase
MGAPPSLDPQNQRYPNWLQVSFKLFLALAASFVVSSFKLDYIESALFDFRLRTEAALKLQNTNNLESVLVLMTSKTIERYQGFPKYKDHTELLQKLAPLDPQFVLYDLQIKDNTFRDIDGSLNDQMSFLQASHPLKNFFVMFDELEMKGEVGKLKLLAPFESLKVGAAKKNYDTTLFAKDGVSRRLLIKYQDQTLLHPTVASYYNSDVKDPEKIRGRFELFDSLQSYVHFLPAQSFPTYSFEDIIDGNVKPEHFRGKIVILGTDTGKSAKEYVTTPYSREVNAMTTAEYHANMFQTLIENKAPVRFPKSINYILTALISILTVYVVLSLKPSRGLGILLLTILGLTLFALVLFAAFGWWVDLAHPYLAVFLCYYFFIPYRLIKENRRSWEYYQKNRLLSQVEELKTNFISMMSHDLNTPLARIKGMTEVITTDPQPLSNHQREAVDTIKNSTEDLLRFINSILQYGRIESQGLELNFQNKDINNVLGEVIKKHEFLARVKRIKIETTLDPLFPIPVDPELIRQVFSNLLENAIKYSREDSTVKVISREEGPEVVIDFVDNGLGIPEEDLPNIFMKFFRSHSVKTSPIKGSGLGLYLAHYFTELHKGHLTVKSVVNQGSIFTVRLPIA